MIDNKRWWEKKWYWVLCILLPLLLGPAIKLFFFPEMPLSRSLVYAIASSVGVLLAYFAVMRKTILNIQPKALRRIIFIAFGTFTVGALSWAFIVLPLASYFDIPGPRSNFSVVSFNGDLRFHCRHYHETERLSPFHGKRRKHLRRRYLKNNFRRIEKWVLETCGGNTKIGLLSLYS